MRTAEIAGAGASAHHPYEIGSSKLLDAFGIRRGSRLLSVWAHPDDESYLAAGLMQAVVAGGGTVVAVTATLGELGTSDPQTWPPARLAAHRRVELRAAMAELGVDTIVEMGHRDGGCDRVPRTRAAASIARLIEVHRPDTVVTFARDGVTGHPDHRAVAAWVALAVGASAEPPALFVTGSARSIPGDVVQRLDELGAYEPGYPDRTSQTDDDVVARLHGRALERKLAALARHASQTEGLRAAFGDAGYARFASYEAYRPANEVARAQMGSRATARWAS